MEARGKRNKFNFHSYSYTHCSRLGLIWTWLGLSWIVATFCCQCLFSKYYLVSRWWYNIGAPLSLTSHLSLLVHVSEVKWSLAPVRTWDVTSGHMTSRELHSSNTNTSYIHSHIYKRYTHTLYKHTQHLSSFPFVNQKHKSKQIIKV